MRAMADTNRCGQCQTIIPLKMHPIGDARHPGMRFCSSTCRDEFVELRHGQKLLPAPRVVDVKDDITKPMTLADGLALECPECKSTETYLTGQDKSTGQCLLCNVSWSAKLCRCCGREIRAMCHLSKMLCQKCDADIRDRTKAMEEDTGPFFVNEKLEPMAAVMDPDVKPMKLSVRDTPGARLALASGSRALLEDYALKPVQEVHDSIQLTAEMGRAMRQQAIDTLKAEGFIVLSPKEQVKETSCIHNTIIQDLDKKLASHQEVVRYVRQASECPEGVSLRDWIEDKMTENRELVAQVERMKSESAAGDSLIDAGGHQLGEQVRMTAKLQKLLATKRAENEELTTKLGSANRLLMELAEELGYAGDVADLLTWAKHREEVIKKQRARIQELEDSLTRSRDTAETYKRLHAKEASVELPQSLWERLFFWCLEEVNDRVEMSNAVPSEVQGTAMIRTAMRTADELWAAAVDYRKNPTKPVKVAGSCVHSWLEWRGHNDTENAGRLKCVRCGVFKDEVGQ